MLESCGFHVLHFWNTDALTETDSVMDTIWATLNHRF
jgi:very-short-patch-repair endonuclease